ncbi:hypothetical protein KSP39_PZI007645 [Platanthera zijinensis]|uniref:Putative plant transposon protein domain-containing protein n=1 Tax=Platanthera zijinensis TaxID=2320716 RepID=A0AAP0BNF8_9ASPA
MGWETFCHPRTEAVLPWVYEFYANTPVAESGTVFVRGKKVNFSASAINSFFDLDDNIGPDHTTMLSSTPKADMTAVICSVLGLDWVSTKENALHSTCLSREAKVWLHFVNTSLLPTRHLNHIQLDRITLIFCIIKGIKVNIGRIISRLIWTKVNDKKMKHIWFPTTITELYRAAGVELGEGDQITQVDRHITETVVNVNIKVPSELPRKPSKLKAVCAAKPPKSKVVAPKRISIPVVDNGTDPDAMSEQLEYLKAYHRCQFVYFNSRLDYICENQAKLMQKARIPVTEPNYDLGSQFDKRGYLLTSDGSRIDPTLVQSKEQEEDEDDEEEK